MFGSSVLEAAIGLIFIYLLLSLICSSLNEGIASLLNRRGKNLFAGIKNLLNDPKFTGLAQQLYTHGLVDGISKEKKDPEKAFRLPSYLPATTFSLALIDILGSQGAGESWKQIVAAKESEAHAAKRRAADATSEADKEKALVEAEAASREAENLRDAAAKADAAHDEARRAAQAVQGLGDFDKLRTASEKLAKALAVGRGLATEFPDPLSNVQRGIEKLPDGPTKESLLVLVSKAKRDAALLSNGRTNTEQQLSKLQTNIEQWFDDAMDRVSGWYKRWTQKVVLVLTVGLVVVANADTIMLAKRFTRDSALRLSLVSAAERTTKDGAASPAENAKARESLLSEAEKLKLPLGWIASPHDTNTSDQIPKDILGWFTKIVGLLISIFAVSLGAPFWFDTLSKFVNIRGAGTPPGESKRSAPQAAKA
jgi:hypothetical protein